MIKLHPWTILPVLIAGTLILSGFRKPESLRSVYDPAMRTELTDMIQTDGSCQMSFEFTEEMSSFSQNGVGTGTQTDSGSVTTGSTGSTDATTGSTSTTSTTGTTGTTSTTGTTGTDGTTIEKWYMGVKNSESHSISVAENSSAWSGTLSAKESSTVTTSIKVREVEVGQHLKVVTDGAASSQPVTLYLVHCTTISYTSPFHWSKTWEVWKIPYTLYQRTCTSVSVDSRKKYGPANAAGLQGLSANSPPRPVNFYGWEYKGGLFIGNMPGATFDQSGSSRTQFYITPPTGSNYCSWTLSFTPFKNASIGPAKDLFLGSVATTDSNYSVTPQNVTWDTKWETLGSEQLAIWGNVAANTRLNFFCPGGSDVAFPSKFMLTSGLEGSTTLAGWTYLVSSAYAATHSGTSGYVPDVWMLAITESATGLYYTYPETGP